MDKLKSAKPGQVFKMVIDDQLEVYVKDATIDGWLGIGSEELWYTDEILEKNPTNIEELTK